MISATVDAASPTPERVLELCAQVDGPAHCARLVEAEQLKSLPNLAIRDGDQLRVSLFPSGARDFVDVTTPDGRGRTYALWDYWSPINAALLFTTDRERIGFALLQRATGQVTVLPAEPFLAPDRQRIAVADFCASHCDNELTVWRVTREGVRRELAFRPAESWSDVTVAWKDADALSIQYTIVDEDTPRKLERKLADTGWQRL